MMYSSSTGTRTDFCIMEAEANGVEVDELALVNVYRDLTGASESQARNVLMFLCQVEHTGDFRNSISDSRLKEQAA